MSTVKTDQDIELIHRHAETMAQVEIEMFVESRRRMMQR
jgi:hypothetical protein